MNNKIDFLCVVYNNSIDTRGYCESLSRMNVDQAIMRCFILDNSDSRVESEALQSLCQEFSFITYLKMPKNLGYFGAFNFFFKTKFFDNRRLVVLCNNDLIFEADFYDTYCNNKKDYPKDVFVVCPDVVTLDGIHQNPHLLKKQSRLSKLKLDLYFSNYYVAKILKRIQYFFFRVLPQQESKLLMKKGYIFLGIGACYILNENFLSRFNGLNYPHFLYGEEAYFSQQIHSVGGRLYFDSMLKVTHKNSATFSKLPKRLVYEYGREGYWKYRNIY